MDPSALQAKIQQAIETYREDNHVPAVMLGIIGGPGPLANIMLQSGTLDPNDSNSPAPRPDTILDRLGDEDLHRDRAGVAGVFEHP